MIRTAQSNWKVSRADEYCLSVRDGTHDSPKFVDSGFPLVTSKHIKDGQLLIDDAGCVSQQDFDEINKRSRVDRWDVIFTMIGTIGEVYLVSEEEPRFAIKNVGLFKCGGEQRAKWLYYWFKNPHTKRALLQARRGASQQYIPLGALRSLEIKHPEEEATMRDVVDHIASFDQLIENNRRRIKLLEESARLLYREWFVHLRFPGHEHVKIVDGVPEGWERKPLKEVATLNYGKALKEELRKPGPFPVYGSSGIVGSHTAGLSASPGIIVGRKGNVGSVFWSSVGFFAIDTVYFINGGQSSLHLYYALQHAQFISTDVAVPGLNRDFAYSRPILVPSDPVLADFHEAVTPMHEQIEKRTLHSDKLRGARDMLLPRLMSGEIAV